MFAIPSIVEKTHQFQVRLIHKSLIMCIIASRHGFKKSGVIASHVIDSSIDPDTDDFLQCHVCEFVNGVTTGE